MYPSSSSPGAVASSQHTAFPSSSTIEKPDTGPSATYAASVPRLICATRAARASALGRHMLMPRIGDGRYPPSAHTSTRVPMRLVPLIVVSASM